MWYVLLLFFNNVRQIQQFYQVGGGKLLTHILLLFYLHLPTTCTAEIWFLAAIFKTASTGTKFSVTKTWSSFTKWSNYTLDTTFYFFTCNSFIIYFKELLFGIEHTWWHIVEMGVKLSMAKNWHHRMPLRNVKISIIWFMTWIWPREIRLNTRSGCMWHHFRSMLA